MWSDDSPFVRAPSKYDPCPPSGSVSTGASSSSVAEGVPFSSVGVSLPSVADAFDFLTGGTEGSPSSMGSLPKMLKLRIRNERKSIFNPELTHFTSERVL